MIIEQATTEDINEDDYQTGFQDGWDSCHRRMIAILKKFPLQCAAITRELESLHPSQPCTALGEDINGF